ncbi:MAG: DUF2254 domain-containing protein [Acidimicrobiales bacterium]
MTAPNRPAKARDRDARSIAARETLRTSLWFIPLAMVGLASLVAELLIRFDRAEHAPIFGFHGDASSAQDLLATVAASNLAMTTLVVSITMVALQLASQQFSPRVMRTFFRDSGTKVALGIFLGTTVYALLVLRVVTPEDVREPEFVPTLSVSVAFVMMLCSLGTFLYYLNHVAHAIRAVHIIDAVSAETRAAIRDSELSDDRLGPGEWPDGPAPLRLGSSKPPGAIISVDEDDLLALAAARHLRVRIVPRVGDYVPSNAPMAEVWSDDPGTAPQLTAAEIASFIGLGRERTMRQDVAFGFRQLVDTANKALSPAVNDPTTAVQVLGRVHDLLRRLAVLPDLSPVRRSPDGTARLLLTVPTWDDLVALACDEIRHFGATSLHVHQRMRAMLDDLEQVVGVGSPRLAALERQRRLLDRAAERAFPDPEDLAAAHTPHAD